MAVAAKLDRTTFRTSRFLDFCSERELTAQIGHPPEDWPLVVVKELVDNAIDACEEAGTAPDIRIRVSDDGISVRDNGPGLPAATIDDILDYSVRVSSREAYVSPTRGAQGNALKTIVAMPFVLDGSCGRLAIRTHDIEHIIEFRVDPIRQEPVIRHDQHEIDWKNGAEIHLDWPVSAGKILEDAKARFLQIADDFTWINPHLRLVTDWNGETCTIEPTSPAWVKWGPSDPTSAHWYTNERFERLSAAYIAYDADKKRSRTVREFISEFRGLSGSQKQKKILDATDLHRACLSDLTAGDNIDVNRLAGLLSAMKEHTRPIKPTMLGVIGKDHFRQRFESVGCEMESFDYKKITDVTDDVPSIIETAFGWCPEADSRRLVTGVNWSSGIINPFRELGSFGYSLDTLLANQRANANEPIILVLHMVCPRVEYADRGKSSVVVRS